MMGKENKLGQQCNKSPFLSFLSLPSPAFMCQPFQSACPAASKSLLTSTLSSMANSRMALAGEKLCRFLKTRQWEFNCHLCMHSMSNLISIFVENVVRVFPNDSANGFSFVGPLQRRIQSSQPNCNCFALVPLSFLSCLMLVCPSSFAILQLHVHLWCSRHG